MTASLVLAALIVVPFAVLLARRGVVRRLALRNAGRRPVETALVVVGSLLGAAIITGSLVVADTLDHSIRQVAFRHLGPVDEVVVTRDPAAFPRLLAPVEPLAADGTADGVVGFELAPASASTDGRAPAEVLPGAQLLELDLEAAARFGSDPAAVGLTGPTPGPGEAVVNADVADALGLEPGGHVSVHAYGQTVDLEVTRVVETRGLAGFRGTTSEATRARNVFVAPGTIDGLVRRAVERFGLSGIIPPERVVAVSNPGGVTGGAEASTTVTRAIERAVGDGAPPVTALKREVLDSAADTSAQLGDLFAAMGAFGTLAGILLLVNLFVMLAEERRREHGTLRALGMPRGLLVASFAAEGWMYGMAASVLGTAAGVGLGRVVVAAVAGAIADTGDDLGLRLEFGFQGSSLAAGFALGLAISVGSVAVTSMRSARLNVIRAIRGLPDPPAPPRWWLVPAALGAAAVGAAWSLAAIAVDGVYGVLLGPLVVFAGVAVAVTAGSGGRLRRQAVSGGAVAALAWATVALRLTLDRMAADPDVNVFVIQGVALTAAAVLLVSEQQDRLVGLVGHLARGRRWLHVRIGLAHPAAGRLRSGLTVAMYALVVFTLTFVTVLAGVFDHQLDAASTELAGGFGIVARWPSTNSGTLDDVADVPGVAAVAPLVTGPITVPPRGDRRTMSWLLSGFDRRFVDTGPPSLSDRGRFGSDEEAYRAVLADPGLAIVDPIFLQLYAAATGRRPEVGDSFEVVEPRSGRVHGYRVAALARTDLAINGALVAATSAEDLFGTSVPSRAYLAVDDGADPRAVARAVMRATAELGVEADAIVDVVGSAAAVQRQFFQLARGYLALGMVVGIAGVGVIMVRAVRDRRREIGILRSLGFQPREVGRTLMVEATFLSSLGAAIGAGLAIVTAYDVVTGTDLLGPSITFSVPVVEVVALVVAAVVVSLAATAVPARAATRTRPAVALRTAD
ncbi:MAG TPA: FtsX-like permease family protein [Acidimicrobiales bacterium]|nr:FtsX-like permease family protein [Acidimicrobiales bacterium]